MVSRMCAIVTCVPLQLRCCKTAVQVSLFRQAWIDGAASLCSRVENHRIFKLKTFAYNRERS
jgi:hypothetical protein